ncbi:hypothetical protein IB279_34070 [Ensifer sp. ENS06]|uniref:hypothetical protein n=1 Tax=Ensifer sp. ENS06 TaxID=2769276 RepID=UPI001785A6E5|nr:hypothetical protein [Ensifer sp. ENS06]MBD9627982.1 hypothetical protein [Ensifer sp. ENS06]
MIGLAKSFEKYLSFGAIGGLLGVCNDIATPLAGSNIYGVIVGAAALVIGLLSGAFLGFGRDAVKGVLGFGFIIFSLSIFFIVNGPDNSDAPTGYMAAEFEGLKKVQDQLAVSLGVIERNTGKIADNTTQLVEHTEDLRGYAIDQVRFHQAIENDDRRTVVLACQSGQRAGATILSNNEKSRDLFHDEDMVQFLVENDCVAKKSICGALFEFEFPFSFMHADFANIDRVNLICGTEVGQKVAEHQAERKKNGDPISKMLQQQNAF